MTIFLTSLLWLMISALVIARYAPRISKRIEHLEHTNMTMYATIVKYRINKDLVL